MSTLLSSANVTDVNFVLKERTHMRLCLNMLIFTHNLGNWLIAWLMSGTYYILHVKWLTDSKETIDLPLGSQTANSDSFCRLSIKYNATDIMG